eukprot:g37095.t1
MDAFALAADTKEFIRLMRLREFFQHVSSEPNEITNETDQSTERSMGERAKKESNWNPAEGRCSRLDRYSQAIRECVNARFISPTHKVVQDVTHAQSNAIRALKANLNIVIKPADKGGDSIVQNR